MLSLASSAAGYAGEPDLPAVESPRPVTAVADGDDVFGLQVVASPGHTPGHICVLDPGAGVLVAGDAIRSDEGSVIGPNPDFTENMGAAHDSVRKLAGLSYETVLVGHGDPVVGGASGAVAALAAGL